MNLKFSDIRLINHDFLENSDHFKFPVDHLWRIFSDTGIKNDASH